MHLLWQSECLVVLLGPDDCVIAVVAVDDVVLPHGTDQHLLPDPVRVLLLKHNQDNQAQDSQSSKNPLSNNTPRAVFVAATLVVAIGKTAVPVWTSWRWARATVEIAIFDARVDVARINVEAVVGVDTKNWIRVKDGGHNDACGSQAHAYGEDGTSGLAPQEGFLRAHVHK